jgi:hypothetical protein
MCSEWPKILTLSGDRFRGQEHFGRFLDPKINLARLVMWGRLGHRSLSGGSEFV